MAKKYVYFFGAGKAEGNKEMKNLLGGKGANLAEMAGSACPFLPGSPCPPRSATYIIRTRSGFPKAVRKEVEKNLKQLEKAVGQGWATSRIPCWSPSVPAPGPPCPAMMDTILNLASTTRLVEALIAKTGKARFAYDSYRRFVQ